MDLHINLRKINYSQKYKLFIKIYNLIIESRYANEIIKYSIFGYTF